MPSAGYSGTPPAKKLGIKSEMKILLINEPENYFALLECDISNQIIKKKEAPDLIHLFVKSNGEFVSEMKKLKEAYKKNQKIILWVSWYKKSANIPTDISEVTIRNYALQNGLVDVKVCAVSNMWSGLKLMVPLAKR